MVEGRDSLGGDSQRRCPRGRNPREEMPGEDAGGGRCPGGNARGGGEMPGARGRCPVTVGSAQSPLSHPDQRSQHMGT